MHSATCRAAATPAARGGQTQRLDDAERQPRASEPSRVAIASQSCAVAVGMRSKMSRSPWTGEAMLLSSPRSSSASCSSSWRPSRSRIAATVTSSTSSTGSVASSSASTARTAAGGLLVAGGRVVGPQVVEAGDAHPGRCDRVETGEGEHPGLGDRVDGRAGALEVGRRHGATVVPCAYADSGPAPPPGVGSGGERVGSAGRPRPASDDAAARVSASVSEVALSAESAAEPAASPATRAASSTSSGAPRTTLTSGVTAGCSHASWRAAMPAWCAGCAGPWRPGSWSPMAR